MTLNEFVYIIADRIQPFLTKDTELSLREIAAEIAIQRSLLIRNELNKKRTIDPNIIQDLGCLKLVETDSSLCCEVPTGCTILVTEKDVPRTIELHYLPSLVRIGPIDRMDKKYELITWDRAPYVGKNKYTKNITYAIYENNKVYIITNNKFLEYINITGVFENPEDLSNFNKCDGSKCYTSDSEYPLNQWMFAYIEDVIVQRYMNIYNIPRDVQTDGVDTNNQNIQEQ